MRKYFLVIFIAFLLVGCGDNIKPIDGEPILPSAIEIINLSGTDEVTVGENTIQLEYVVTPSDASQEIIWSSSDELIATVDENGIVTGIDEGIVLIRVTSAHDDLVYAEYEILVYNDGPSHELISEIKSYLNDVLPNKATEKINLPNFYDGKIRLYWSSSDIYTITNTGNVIPAKTDQSVTLTATFKVGRVNGEFSKTINVPKYQLKSRDNKKLTFTYLFDAGGFTGFRKGDLEKIDVINLAFGGIVNGKLSVAGIQNLETIISKAHAVGTRVVLAIGGWGVDGFSQATRTEDSRKIFVESIIDGIKKYRFDGIDIDWEYPTSSAAEIESHPSDKKNLTYFMHDLRAEMNKLDKDLILSIAVAAGARAADTYYEVSKLNDYIDFMHVMTYDFTFGPTSATHLTNLYNSDYSVASADAGVRAYSDRGIPKKKIILGAAFYGHIFTTKNDGPNNNGLGASLVSNEPKSISYRNIVANYLNNPLYKVYFDDKAKANFIYGQNTYITYESPESIKYKAEYVRSNGLGGMMVWEYTQDDNNSTLLDAINKNLYK